MIILAKKRYVGWIFEDNPNKKKLYMIGIVLKRRDNSKIVKKIYKGIL
jgi:DNA polymerase elongation subunit (family B)